MYILDNETGEKHYCAPIGSTPETTGNEAGEMMFYIAYGEKFYGRKQWYCSDHKQYEEANCTYIYRLVDAVKEG